MFLRFAVFRFRPSAATVKKGNRGGYTGQTNKWQTQCVQAVTDMDYKSNGYLHVEVGR